MTLFTLIWNIKSSYSIRLAIKSGLDLALVQKYLHVLSTDGRSCRYCLVAYDLIVVLPPTKHIQKHEGVNTLSLVLI